MRIAFIISDNESVVSGPKNSVTLLSQALFSVHGVVSKVFSTAISQSFKLNGVKIHPCGYAQLKKFDLVVFSGIYDFQYIKISRFLVKNRIPYVISPRSSFVRFSLLKSWHKKLIFMALYGRRFVKKALAIHFLSEEERRNSFFENKKYFISPNIVPVCSGFDVSEKKKVIGFLGRYDFNHKGIDLFVKAISHIQDDLRRHGWVVETHGSTSKGGDKEYLLELIEKNGLGDFFKVGGALYGEEKRNFYKKVSLFVHFSRYEGLPQAMIESMAYGCVIGGTPGTNMQDLINKRRCGICLSYNPRVASHLITQLISSFPFHDIGLNARQASLEDFSESAVSSMFVSGVKRFL